MSIVKAATRRAVFKVLTQIVHSCPFPVFLPLKKHYVGLNADHANAEDLDGKATLAIAAYIIMVFACRAIPESHTQAYPRLGPDERRFPLQHIPGVGFPPWLGNYTLDNFNLAVALLMHTLHRRTGNSHLTMRALTLGGGQFKGFAPVNTAAALKEIESELDTAA